MIKMCSCFDFQSSWSYMIPLKLELRLLRHKKKEKIPSHTVDYPRKFTEKYFPYFLSNQWFKKCKRTQVH